MVFISLFSWWYTTGWLTLVRKGGMRIKSTLNFFSVPLLVTSLFAPFRQIAAGQVQGSLNAQLQAWGDRLFSRFIGAIVRSFLIVIGLITVGVMGLIVAVATLIWPLMPFAPLIAVVIGGLR